MGEERIVKTRNWLFCDLSCDLMMQNVKTFRAFRERPTGGPGGKQRKVAERGITGIVGIQGDRSQVTGHPKAEKRHILL